eukprot:2928760-Heterocapsa_arctica.AAC.1
MERRLRGRRPRAQGDWVADQQLTHRETRRLPCSNKLPGVVNHRHVHLIGGKASATEVYPNKLVWAILGGLVDQLRIDRRSRTARSARSWRRCQCCRIMTTQTAARGHPKRASTLTTSPGSS